MHKMYFYLAAGRQYAVAYFIDGNMYYIIRRVSQFRHGAFEVKFHSPLKRRSFVKQIFLELDTI